MSSEEVCTVIFVELEVILVKAIKAQLTDKQRQILRLAISSAVEQCHMLKDYIVPQRKHKDIIKSFESVASHADYLLSQVQTIMSDKRSLAEALNSFTYLTALYNYHRKHLSKLRKKLAFLMRNRRSEMAGTQAEARNAKRLLDRLSTISEHDHLIELTTRLQANLVAIRMLAQTVLENSESKPGSTSNHRIVIVGGLAEAWHQITGRLPGVIQSTDSSAKVGPFVDYIQAFFKGVGFPYISGTTIRDYLEDNQIQSILNPDYNYHPLSHKKLSTKSSGEIR